MKIGLLLPISVLSQQLTETQIKQAFLEYFDYNDGVDHGDQQQWYDILANYVKAKDSFDMTDANGEIRPAYVDFYNFWQDMKADGNLKGACDEDEPISCGGIFSLKHIWGYGCWCNFGSKAGIGRGNPVDATDALCKSLQQCYRCAVWDGKQEGETCYPWETKYDLLSVHNNKGLRRKCARSNPNDDCAFRTCCCETRFAEDLFRLYFESAATGIVNYSRNLKHKHGFNWENECKYSPPDEFKKGCCGEYPERFPYNALKDSCPVDMRSIDRLD